MIAPARARKYRLAEGAKAPAETATAYRLKGSKTASAVQIGKALRVENPDGVEVREGFGWHFSRRGDDVVTSGTEVACPPEGKCPEPPAPAPPEGLLTPAEAESRFREILNDLGVDIDAGTIEVLPGSFDVRVVSFLPTIRGIEVVGLETSIAFGENGRVEYANGFLGRFDEVGEYPLVDLAEALERFHEGFAFDAGPGTGPQGMEGGADNTGDVRPPGPREDEPTMTIEPRSQPPVPLEPETVEPEIVEITGAEVVLEVVFPMCEDGEIYLVPAYRLLPEDTAGFTVTAVEDEYLAAALEPEAADSARPCPGDEPAGVPMGRPEPAPDPARP